MASERKDKIIDGDHGRQDGANIIFDDFIYMYNRKRSVNENGTVVWNCKNNV